MNVRDSKPLVSIVVPVFRAEKFIRETISSVLAQTEASWELLLIVDALSDDASLAICREYAAREERIRVLVDGSYRGVAANRNAGIKAARGAWVAFLDADDVWLPQKLAVQIRDLLRSDRAFGAHSYDVMDENGRLLSRRRVLRKRELVASDLLRENSVGCFTVIIRQDLLEGKSFQDGLPHEDWIFWMRVLGDRPELSILCSSEILGRYRQVQASRSSSKVKAAWDRWRLLRQELRVPLLPALFYFAHYALAGLRKLRF